ncbi:hypothetical protein PUNSTDRAFT_134118 [Punctularia strigosozonata HHB-11173 SS5]|uniref:uncharacterized protein n=1 Tax=Punctularia strigosozonata (strain HHB-11173) TaxID=741275 RepID=UPI0004417EE7|nr:uncharacterized protein PUNSTDRAFT_134118 [Punctularia strigosozonata HHB-11173 SS5]EIN08945.1 hypothetical protein PUNSTDRAFT_134118 [Punctularia strigosozonata HHB-11173 SS5]
MAARNQIVVTSEHFFPELHTTVGTADSGGLEAPGYGFVNRILTAWALSARVSAKKGTDGALAIYPQCRIDSAYKSKIQENEWKVPDFAAVIASRNADTTMTQRLVYTWECKISKEARGWWHAGARASAVAATLVNLDQVELQAKVAMKAFKINKCFAFLRVDAHFCLIRFFKPSAGRRRSSTALSQQPDPGSILGPSDSKAMSNEQHESVPSSQVRPKIHMEFKFFVRPIFVDADSSTTLRLSPQFLGALREVGQAAAKHGLSFPEDTFFTVAQEDEEAARPGDHDEGMRQWNAYRKKMAGGNAAERAYMDGISGSSAAETSGDDFSETPSLKDGLDEMKAAIESGQIQPAPERLRSWPGKEAAEEGEVKRSATPEAKAVQGGVTVAGSAGKGRVVREASAGQVAEAPSQRRAGQGTSKSASKRGGTKK